VVVVRKLVERIGFVLLPVRWRVERTLAWLGRHRRLAKDYEELPECSEAHLYLASVSLLLKRLVPCSV
jgi:putative transposase